MYPAHFFYNILQYLLHIVSCSRCNFTNNVPVPLILKVREVIFFSRAQDNLGVKKVSALWKNSSKCPIVWFAQGKKLTSHT
jgi:hypothetical protein